ncbi:MAG: sigma-54 dependent transcriptional regulator [Chitinophagaceae bacterium]
MNTKLLIVEDQFIEANNLKLILKGAGYEVCSIARSVPIALSIVEKERPDLVLIDIFLQGELTGIDLAKTLENRNIPFVYISANSNKEVLDAAKATQPYGFLVKPFRKKDVLVMLDVAWYLYQQRQEKKSMASGDPGTTLKQVVKAEEIRTIIGESRGIQDLLKNIKIVSQSNTSVLILGENGTGKELVAKAIHENSPRKHKPLVVVNCAALPANLIESELFGHEKGAFTGATGKRIGKFEQANEGTIFLDEIGELPMDVQAKFLRVLQEKEIESVGGETRKVNVRVVAATNRNLEEEVAANNFRVDLYYRLNVFPLELPPLRERREDILPLAHHFLKMHAAAQGKLISGFAARVEDALLQHNWPGNVRELQNLIERAVLLAEGQQIESLHWQTTQKGKTPAVTAPSTLKTMTENERDHIISVLESCNWKIAGRGGAAEILDVNVSTLNSRIKKLGISKEIVLRREKNV